MVTDHHIESFLNDITTALPYSNYIKTNIGNYVILQDKPYIIKGMKFRHYVDSLTRADGYVIQCFVILDNTRDDAYFSLYFNKEQIVNCMDKPMVLIDLINSHLRQKLQFIAKNKTTDLLFKNEG